MAVMLEPMPGGGRVDLHPADRVDRDVRRVHHGISAGSMGVAYFAVCHRPYSELPPRLKEGDFGRCPFYIPHAGIVSRASGMHDAAKTAITARLRRIEGQVGGLLRMVDEDRYC